MKRRKTFGTKYFGGLNVKDSPSIREDGDLQVCTNVARVVNGEISPAKEPEFMYDSPIDDQGLGYGMCSVVTDGTVKVMRATGNYIYSDETRIGNSGGETKHRFISDGRRTYVLNGIKNMVWDGYGYRYHGPMQIVDTITEQDCQFYFPYISESAVTVTGSITSIVKSAPCVIVDSSHGLNTGDRIYITGVVGMTEINGLNFTVTKLADNYFSLDGVDSTDFTDYDSGGTWSLNRCPNTGTYKYIVTYEITTSSGQVIESEGHQVSEVFNPREHSFNITAGGVVYINALKVSEDYLALYTTDTSATVRAVVYRTKDDGSEYYEIGYIPHSSIVKSGTSGALATASFTDTVPESESTVSYLDLTTDHGMPPQGTIGVFCQQRLFIAGDSEYPNRIYYSMIGKYEYFSPTNYIDCIDTISALGRYAEHVLIFTPSGIKLFSPVGAFGQLSDTQSPVGCEHPDSICAAEFGTIFCRSDGIWLFDGITSRRISDDIESLVKASNQDAKWVAGYTAGHFYASCGDGTTVSDSSFEFYRIGDKILWSVDDNLGASNYIAVSGSPDDIFIYGLRLDGAVEKLNSSSINKSITIKTKAYGDGVVRRWIRIRIDADSSSSLIVVVETNRGNTISITIPATYENPMSSQMRYDLPVSMLGETCEVTITGTPDRIRSIILETE
jgi:hypothetical protein